MSAIIELTTAAASVRRAIRNLLFGAPQVRAAATTPTLPEGDVGVVVLWYDTANSALKLWDGASWQQVSPSTAHTHSISDVTGLSEALSGKASSAHTHSISDVTGLSDSLSGKAAASHTHSISDVTGLSDALSGKASTSHTHTIGDVSGLATALGGKSSLFVSDTMPADTPGGLWYDTASDILKVRTGVDTWVQASARDWASWQRLMVYVPAPTDATILLDLQVPGSYVPVNGNALEYVPGLPVWKGTDGDVEVAVYAAPVIGPAGSQFSNVWCLSDPDDPFAPYAMIGSPPAGDLPPWAVTTFEYKLESGGTVWGTGYTASAVAVDNSVFIGQPANFSAEPPVNGTPGWMGRLAVDASGKLFVCAKNDMGTTNDGWSAAVMSTL